MACNFGSKSSMKSRGELIRVRARPLAKQRSLEQRLGNLLAGTRHRDGNAEVALDALVLADQYVEDDSIDGVVRSVVGHHPHLALLLPEAVHSTFALLVARRVHARS